MRRWMGLLRVLAFVFVLVPATLVCLAYFALNHGSLGREVVRHLLSDLPPGALTFGRIEVEPWPGEVRLYDVVVRGRDGGERLRAAYVAADVAERDGSGPLFLLAGATAVDFELTLDWDGDGRLGLVEAFKRPGRPPRPPTPPSEPSRFVLAIDDIRLLRGRVHLRWPRFGLDFAGVDAHGRLQVGPAGALEIDADARGVTAAIFARGLEKVLPADLRTRFAPPAGTELGPGGVWLGWTTTRIDQFRWRGDGFNAASVALDIAGETLRVRPTMAFPSGPIAFDYAAEGALAPALLANLTGGAPGAPVTFEARASGDGKHFTLELPRLAAPRLPLAAGVLQGFVARDVRLRTGLEVARFELGALELGDWQGVGGSRLANLRAAGRAQLASRVVSPWAVPAELVRGPKSAWRWLRKLPAARLAVTLGGVTADDVRLPPFAARALRLDGAEGTLEGYNGTLRIPGLVAAEAEAAGYTWRKPRLTTELAIQLPDARLVAFDLEAEGERWHATGQGRMTLTLPPRLPFTVDLTGELADAARVGLWLHATSGLPADVAQKFVGPLTVRAQFAGPELRSPSSTRLAAGSVQVGPPGRATVFSAVGPAEAAAPAAGSVWRHDARRAELEGPAGLWRYGRSRAPGR